jgi:hypothetical protein
VNSPEPDVSVVFETENDEPNHRIRLTDVMASWLRQTAVARVAEWIVVSPRTATPEEKALLARAPARWIERSGARYYGLKNDGIRQARGRFIAMADSDALPADDWLEIALAVLERSDPSVALLTGRTRYMPGPFSREMAIAQLPNQADLSRDTTHFLAHNVLLRTEIVRSLLFSGDEIRLGSDTHLAGRLIETGYRLRYDPSLRATHNYGRHWKGSTGTASSSATRSDAFRSTRDALTRTGSGTAPGDCECFSPDGGSFDARSEFRSGACRFRSFSLPPIPWPPHTVTKWLFAAGRSRSPVSSSSGVSVPP